MPEKEISEFLKKIPVFEKLTQDQLNGLGSSFYEEKRDKDQTIISEGDPVDVIYLLTEGVVEVSTEGEEEEVVAEVFPGDLIGVDDARFLSFNKKHAFKFLAFTPVTLFKCEKKAFKSFLEKHPDALSLIREMNDKMLKFRFLKMMEPFQEVPPEMIQEFASQISMEKVSKGHTFFKEGDEADSSYLLSSGEVEISYGEKKDTLEAVTMFGLIAPLCGTTRPFTATAQTDCEVMKLEKDQIERLITHADGYESLVMLMMERFRPKRVKGVTTHKRKDSHGETVVVLKDAKRGKYYKTSEEGLFIWNLLDGNHTVKDISVSYFYEYKKFATNDISNIVYSLIHSGFLTKPSLSVKIERPKESRSIRIIEFITSILTAEYVFKNVDGWFAGIYNKFGKFFYTSGMKIVLTLLTLIGAVFFFMMMPHMEMTLQSESHSWRLVLYAYLSVFLTIPFHELGHALTTKAYGRSVNGVGVGWFWLGPVVYIDTSDMWLDSKYPRTMVNVAGPFVNLAIGGALSLIAYSLTSTMPLFATFLWLAALYNYLFAWYNCDPLIELDGYYILSDLFDKPSLRALSMEWMVSSRKFTKENLSYITYWFSCFAFILISAFIAYFIQNKILVSLFHHSHQSFLRESLRYLLFFFVIGFSFLSLYLSFRRAKRN